MSLATASDRRASAAAEPARRRWRMTRRSWLLAGFLFLVLVASAALVWGLYSELHDAMSPRALRWALAFAAVPVVPLAAFFIWLDRLRPEPKLLLGLVLLWGALAAAYFSLRLNGWLSRELGDVASVTPRGAIFVAPWVEETTKAAIVFAVVWWRRHDFNAVVAGVVYGGLAGVGFAFTENVLYYGQVFEAAVKTGSDNGQALQIVTDLFQWRGLATPFVHPMFTMLTGVGIGLAVRHRHLGVRLIAPVAGFCAAVLMHMSYNSLVTFVSEDHLVAAYVPLLLPTLACLVVIVLLVRRHEHRVLRARLHDYTAFGWLRPEHVDFIATWTGRRAARQHARRLGKEQRRRVRRFQRTGMDLAVLRDRMVRGVAGAKELARERELIDSMRWFRGRVMLPGTSERPVDSRAPLTSSW